MVRAARAGGQLRAAKRVAVWARAVRPEAGIHALALGRRAGHLPRQQPAPRRGGPTGFCFRTPPCQARRSPSSNNSSARITCSFMSSTRCRSTIRMSSIVRTRSSCPSPGSIRSRGLVRIFPSSDGSTRPHCDAQSRQVRPIERIESRARLERAHRGGHACRVHRARDRPHLASGRCPSTWSRNDTGDTVLHEWIMAWVAHQVVHDPVHLFDANIFYPERNTLAYSDPLIVQALLGAPLLWAGASPVLVKPRLDCGIRADRLGDKPSRLALDG